QRVNGYHYFRKTGHKRIRLPGVEGSPEFEAAYELALSGRGPDRLARVGFTGSLAWVIGKYASSSEFNSKAPSTRRAYLASLRVLRDAPIAQASLRDINRQHINAHCTEIEQRSGCSRGDHQAMMLSIVWDFADRHLPQCRLDSRSNPTRRRRRSYEATP